MRNFLIAFVFLLSLTCQAQTSYWRHLKSNTPTYGLVFVSGMANGASDVIKHKYTSSKFPQSGKSREYWDSKDSWKRKYKDWPDDKRAAYPGSKTWLVWTTDGWHMTKTVQLQATKGAILLYNRPEPKKQKDKWWWTVADFAIITVAFSAGWNASEALLLKN